MKTKVTNTAEYIEQFPKWKEQLEQAAILLEETDLEASIKWGAPCYGYGKRNLIGLAGFKNHCAIWFHEGALLSDSYKVLGNAQPGKTKFLRNIQLKEGEQFDTVILKEYINETIRIAKSQDKPK